jgi:hypothetical protein
MPLFKLRLKTTNIHVLFLFMLFAGYAHGQENPTIVKLVNTAENYFDKLPSEKLYLHFDKPYYSVGDTLWFKSYLLKAADYTASAQSTKLYVDLINDSSVLIKQLVIPLSAGLGQGYFALDANLYDGNYHVRAYTNWMQNFGEDAFFNKQFYIGKPAQQGGWMASEQHTVKTTATGKHVDLSLQLNDMDGRALPYRDIEIKLMDGKKTLFNVKNLTTDAGVVNASFALSPKADNTNLTLVVEDKTGKNSTLSIPFYPGGQQQQPADLQFMPEGGSMIAGLYNKVGFKIIGDDGKGIAVKGSIRDSKNEEIITFQSLHNGMGNFMLLPQAGEKYTVDFTTADGIKQTVALPAAKPSGIALRIDNITDADSVRIYITATPDAASAINAYTLIAQSKDVIHFGNPFNLENGFSNLRLAKKMLPTGIVSFVILDALGNPVNERRVFIDLNNQLQLSLANSETSYQPKDSVAVTVNVKDKEGKPVRGTFSVAVTDDGVVKDKNDGDNIVSRFLLTSELKGNVEAPGWYVRSTGGADRLKALDNLLLTQGWTGYDWKGLPATPPKFEAGADSRVSGKLEGFLKKPVANTKVSLFASSKKYGMILIDTVSDANGRFVFENLPLVDTIAYTIKAHNAKGKEINANIILDPFKPSPAILPNSQRLMPWYANASDSLMIKYFNRPGQTALPGINANDVKGKLLTEVVIKSKKEPIKIGKEFGYPKAELTEQDLINAGKKTLADLIYQRFKSVKLASYYSVDAFKRPGMHNSPEYVSGTLFINDVFIDGQSVQNIYGGDKTGDPKSYNDFLRMFFNYISADDVKNMKLVEGEHAFMTITTRSGAGVFTRVSPGSIAFRPPPMLFAKQFYSPRYVVKNNAPDNRTTIFWEPNLVTDENGKATLSFYTADKPSTYTIRVEGTDMAGNFGYQTGNIRVTAKAPAGK